MSRPYGTRPRKSFKAEPGSPPTEIQVNITGRHTMEQLAFEVQRALAMVQDYGVAGVERFRFRLMPLDAEAKPIVLRDGEGRQVLTIDIPDVPELPPYRANEPGVEAAPRDRPPQQNAAPSQKR